ncbi:MAG: glutathione peroxidase [Proteobacteria bacterium]|nr:glutathione peroxidase [Pseudomonadota bacterium]MBS0465476.1 glutathione peroxidase [Pseudomonadota bacterium]
MASVYDFSAQTIDGKELSLSVYRGKALLIVNVASKCGFTPQYTGLEAMYRKHQAEGLEVLGFPCDQFGHQEPGDAEEIKRFCAISYDVTFPMFARIEVNGANAHPLWKWLKQQKGGILGLDAIKWNFSKFLVGRDGQVVKRYAPIDTPDKIEHDLAGVLG